MRTFIKVKGMKEEKLREERELKQKGWQ